MEAAVDDLQKTVDEAKTYSAGASHHLEELQGYIVALNEDAEILEKLKSTETDATKKKAAEDLIRTARTLRRAIDKQTYPLIRARQQEETDLRKAEIEARKAATAAATAAATKEAAPVNGNGNGEKKSSGIKIPHLKLPIFSGDIEHYRGFKQILIDVLKEEGEDVAPVKKWLLLKDHLSGKALELVAELPPSPETYQVALEMLDEAYGSVNKAVTLLYQRLQELEKADMTITSLRLTNNRIEGLLRSLELLEEDVTNNRFLRTVAIAKFPNELHSILKVTDETDLPRFRKKLGTYIRNNENSLERIATPHPKPVAATSTSSNSNRGNGNRQRFRQNSGRGSTSTENGKKENDTSTAEDKRPKKQSKPPNCAMCVGQHYTDECDIYKTLEQRIAKTADRCSRCLRAKHDGNCRSDIRCAHCSSYDHNRALCPKKFAPIAHTHHIFDEKIGDQREVIKEPDDCPFMTLILTAAASAASPDTIETRALIDPGARRTLITRSLMQQLGLKENENQYIQLVGALSVPLTKSPSTTCTLYLRPPGHPPVELTAIIVDKITDEILGASVESFKLQHPQFTNLTMPNEGNGREVDLLLGTRSLLPILTLHKSIYVSANTQLFSTKFGWVILGGCEESNAETDSTATTMFLQDYDPVKLMCDLDVVGLKDIERGQNEEEAIALQKFYSTLQMIEKRYQVAIPYRYDPPDLTDNFGLAWGRLQSLYKKLSANQDLLNAYDEQIRSHVADGVVEAVYEKDKKGGLVHYIPHQAVVRLEKSTPVRVVYDASSHTGKNRSLNDNVLKGTNWVEDLPALLIRFRMRAVGITADVSKAFHQLSIRPEDRDVCRFLWLKNPQLPPTPDNLQIYRFCRVAFGVASSPFLLFATINFHLTKYQHEFTQILERDFYADNLVTSVDSSVNLPAFYKKSKESFDTMSMNLTKWVSNSPDLLNAIPESDKITEINQTVLGMRWNTHNDMMALNIQQHIFSKQTAITKRQTLKQTATIFDPLGWAMPIVLMARIFIRKLWEKDYSWDQPIDNELCTEWQQIKQSLRNVNQIELPRKMFSPPNSDPKKWEIHVFSDASKDAYAAVVYIKSENEVQFVAAKARLAPKTKVSTPRLELLGAVIAARFSKYIKTALKTEHELPVTLWCDAKCVLAWLRTNKILPSYVQKLVREVRTHNIKAYNYVPSDQNSADVASRGADLQTLKNMNWWSGPEWLPEEKAWPKQDLITDEEAINQALKLEEEEQILLTRVNVTLQQKFDPKIIDKPPFNLNPADFSTLPALLKRSAYIVTAVNRIFLKRIQRKPVFIEDEETNYKFVKYCWLYWDQHRAYKEIAAKAKAKPAYLRNLNIFRDEEGLLRCVTRLEKSEANPGTIHPILLVKNSPLTELIVLQAHTSNMHAGTAHTLAAVRRQYWLPHGRHQVNRIIKEKCLSCRKHFAQPFATPDMAQLPKFRITKTETPFTNVGIDCFGPYKVRVKENQFEKRWIVLFTCLVVRAVHLEVIQNMKTVHFLQAFRRFAARRGVPSVIVSDNAPQFMVIDQRFESLWHCISKNQQIVNYFAVNEIKWRFIPQYTPWMGGVYERLIKTAKDAFEKTHPNTNMDDEQFATSITEIEAMLNSRPIAYVDKNIDTPLITPNHFLTVQFPAIPLDFDRMQNNDEINELWKAGENYLNIYWKHWSEHYLLALQERRTDMNNPHLTEKREPRVGEVVLVVDPTTRRSSWRKAFIENLIRSDDGKIRSAQIKLATGGRWIRPVSKLLPLDLLVDLPEAKRMKLNATRTALIFPSSESSQRDSNSQV